MKDLGVSARAGVTLALFAASVLTASAQGTGPDISGIYWITQYNAKVQLVGGENCR